MLNLNEVEMEVNESINQLSLIEIKPQTESLVDVKQEIEDIGQMNKQVEIEPEFAYMTKAEPAENKSEFKCEVKQVEQAEVFCLFNHIQVNISENQPLESII